MRVWVESNLCTTIELYDSRISFRNYSAYRNAASRICWFNERVGFWQSRYKVPDHGALHGLPYSVKNNGGTKTEKSDDTALVMMQSIADMPYQPNAIWFEQEDVTYQGGTDREFPAVHIFDDQTKVAAVFNKQTGNFVTTC